MILLLALLSVQDPPRMPDYGKSPPPPARAKAEVEAALAGAEAVEDPKPLRICLVAGRKDHGPGEHDYPAWLEVWSRLFKMGDRVEVAAAREWPLAEQFANADVVVFYQQGVWTPARAKDLDAFLARGGGAAYLHWAVDGGADSKGFAERIGLSWKGGLSKYRHGPLELSMEAAHPLARGLKTLKLHDESYWNLVGDPAGLSLLASAPEEGAARPLMWTAERGAGRVFVSIPGHFMWTFDDPLFRLLVLRGISWTAKRPIDRLNSLVWPGARIAP